MRTSRYIKSSDWVTIAERLAAKHEGLLPNPQALIESGYWALYQQMRRHPGLYKHIKQARLLSVGGVGCERPSANVQREHDAGMKRNSADAVCQSFAHHPKLPTGPFRVGQSLSRSSSKCAPSRGRGAWVRMLVPSWRNGHLYRTDMPTRVLHDTGVQSLVFKPPGRRQAAVIVRKTAKLVTWFETVPRRHKGKTIGPFNVDLRRRCLSR